MQQPPLTTAGDPSGPAGGDPTGQSEAPTTFWRYSSDDAATAAAVEWQLPGTRFQVVEELARGGMGVVLRAIDTDFDRPLAIKIMLGPAHASRELRFLEEARIMGQLQHPGVAPVHEIGRQLGGRPYFAMKLIEGRTLADLLHGRSGPQEDLPRFLKIFEQVAQTVAYAHAQGVLHRDLKPANIMVGAFGEVQVMDWGLAMRLHGGPAAVAVATSQAPRDGAGIASTLRDPPAGDGSTHTADMPPSSQAGQSGSHDSQRLTLAGQVLGTPAYMSPEQAQGAIDGLDERTDVFGLGGVLCVILTGAPPYRSGAATVLAQAASADLTEAHRRLAACGAEHEWVELCRDCLQADAAMRPPHAGIVADRAGDVLARAQERVQQARIAAAEAEVRAREDRKRRRLAVGLAAAVVLLALAGGGTAVWRLREQAQRAAHAARLDSAVAAALDAAQQQREELHDRLRDERQAAVLLSDMAGWQTLAESAQAAHDRAAALVSGSRESISPDLAARLASDEKQLLADRRDRELVRKLDAIRLDAVRIEEGRLDLGRSAARLETAFSDAGFDVAREPPEKLAGRLRASPIRLPLVAGLDYWALVTDDEDVMVRLLAVAGLIDPDPWRDRFRDPGIWRDKAALQALADEADLARQSPQLLAALAQRLRLTGADAGKLLRRAVLHYPSDFWLSLELGMSSRNPEEQAGAFRAALAVRPEVEVVLYNLGYVRYSAGQWAEAETCFRRAIGLHPDYAEAHNNLGLVLAAQGQPAAALASFQEAKRLNPKSSGAYANIASLLIEQGQHEEALAESDRALAVMPDSQAVLNNKGVALRYLGRFDEAVATLQHVVRIAPNHAMAWCNLGHTLVEQGRFAEGLAALERGHEIGARQADWTYPSADWVAQTRRKVAADARLADVLSGVAVPREASEWLDLADLCLMNKRRFSDAVRFYAAAFEADPGLTQTPDVHRYNAACAAALALGQEPSLDDHARARLRQQALGWLQAELAALQLSQEAAATREQARTTLAHWQTDPDLASVRDESALAAFPADERAAWQALWADVERAADP